MDKPFLLIPLGMTLLYGFIDVVFKKVPVKLPKDITNEVIIVII